MKKTAISVALFSALNLGAQQISSAKWRDIFSYNNVLVIKNDGARLIAATENGLFYYNPATGDASEKLSKANGLHNVGISAFDYNADTKTGLIGYEDGTLDVISPDGIFLVVDIPLANGYTGSKKINHIFIKDDRAIISVGYGVSVFDLKKREFLDTAFFSTKGTFEAANEAVIKENTVYVATPQGLKSHEMGAANFPVYSTWQTIGGNFTQISAEGNNLAYGNKNSVILNGNPVSQTFGNVKDITFSSENMMVTDENNVYVFSTSGALQNTLQPAESLTTAHYFGRNLYAGSAHSGIIDANKNSIKPDGPYANTSYKLLKIGNEMWVTSGVYFGFQKSKNNLGYYHFDGEKWLYPEFFLNNTSYDFNVLDIAANPSDTSEVFFTNALQSGSKGIFRMAGDKFSAFYTDADTPYIRVPVNVEYDENNELYATKQWASLNSRGWGTNILLSHFNKATNSFENYPELVTQDVKDIQMVGGMMYIDSSSNDDGSLVLYKYNKTTTPNDDRFRFITSENGLPAKDGALCSALDKNGDLWIGSVGGLRILQNAESALADQNPKAEPIIITQNGIPEELFRDTSILSIAVDSGNQKWVSVTGGVYYLSANGDKIIHHFTKENSPLPTNEVTDIKIDEKTGTVYFVTLSGIVTYQGDVSNVSSAFGKVLVYPNPVIYSQFKGNVKIKGLAEKTNIRITDAAGNLVKQDVANGGFYEWDLTTNRGKRVASGIYFVLMTNADGTDKATAKIAVVN